jgi:uncharacterized membrane protein (DUF106 family)
MIADEHLANVVTVISVILGLYFVLVIGYIVGYKDGKKNK